MLILGFLHLLFGIIILFIEIVRIRARKGFDFLSLITIVFAVFYGFAAGAFHLANYIGYNYAWSRYADYGLQAYPLSLAFIVIAYLFLRAGWFVADKSQANNLTSRYRFTDIHTEHRLNIKIIVIGWSFLIISIVAYYLYSQAYGGFAGLSAVSNAIRGGWITLDNPWSFLKRFGGFSVISLYLFLAATKGQAPGIWKRISLVGLILSFIFSTYVLMTWQGRLTLAFYFLTLFLSYIALSSRRIGIIKMIIPLALMSLLLYAGDSILYLFRQATGGAQMVATENPGFEPAADFILGELSFPIVSINAAINGVYNGLTNLRFLSDIPIGIVYLIPESWYEHTVDTVSTVNTNLIDPSKTGTVPTDMISFAIYSFGVFGPPIVAFLFGMGARLMQGYITRIQPAGLRTVFYFAFGLAIAKALSYADPVHFLEGSFYLLVGSAITLLFLKIRIGGLSELQQNDCKQPI